MDDTFTKNYLRFMEKLCFKFLEDPSAPGQVHFEEKGVGRVEYLDADCVSVWIAKSMLQAGHRVRFRAISQDVKKPNHHVYVEVWHPAARKWIALDPWQTKGGFREADGKHYDQWPVEVLGRDLEL